MVKQATQLKWKGVIAELKAQKEREASGKDEFSVGSRVEARFEGGDEWYPGVVSELNADGSCSVRYDDGDEEKRVPRTSIRKVDPNTKVVAGKSDSERTQTSATGALRESPSLLVFTRVALKVDAANAKGSDRIW